MQASLFTAAFGVCVFAAGILGDQKKSNGRSVVYFTCFLAIETLGLILEMLMVYPAIPLKALWLGLRMGTSLLVAPGLWFAIKESVEGVSPLPELANCHRIERAKKLLAGAPDQSVLEIAWSVGFNSKSALNAAFRRITGKTPSQYRLAAEVTA